MAKYLGSTCRVLDTQPRLIECVDVCSAFRPFCHHVPTILKHIPKARYIFNSIRQPEGQSYDCNWFHRAGYSHRILGSDTMEMISRPSVFCFALDVFLLHLIEIPTRQSQMILRQG